MNSLLIYLSIGSIYFFKAGHRSFLDIHFTNEQGSKGGFGSCNIGRNLIVRSLISTIGAPFVAGSRWVKPLRVFPHLHEKCVSISQFKSTPGPRMLQQQQAIEVMIVQQSLVTLVANSTTSISAWNFPCPDDQKIQNTPTGGASSLFTCGKERPTSLCWLEFVCFFPCVCHRILFNTAQTSYLKETQTTYLHCL